MKFCLVVLVGVLASSATRASAQIPTRFTNLQVLPADTAQPALIMTMREFATGLGVRCNYCHASTS